VTADQEHTERVDKLRAQITRFTGRVTVSRDLTYLEQRLASLKKSKADGKRMPTKPGQRPDPSAFVGVSLTEKRRELLLRVCKERKTGASAIMREAFDAWATSNGYRTEIAHIKRLETAED
jgi:hypothetical protein